MKKNRQEILEYINSLEGYEGYVQFSDRPIENIWTQKSNISTDAKDGFVYEAHFYNGSDSISIKQVNDVWLVDETKDTPLTDTQDFVGINNLKVKMAQIWEAKVDPLCEGMKVKKLKKVVFVGFEKGEKNDNSTI